VAFDLSGVSRSSVTKATLVLTVAKNLHNWGSQGGLVEVHPLLEDFTEGNGKSLEVPAGEQTRGTGAGVTWACATDTNIANLQSDCHRSRWMGGDFGPATDSVLHTNSTTGEVSFDVTSDVQAGSSAWLVKKLQESNAGRVNYYSREGAAAAGKPEFAPKLLLEEEEACMVQPAGSCDPSTPGQCCGSTCNFLGGFGDICQAPSGAPCDLAHPEGCQSLTCINGSPQPHCA